MKGRLVRPLGEQIAAKRPEHGVSSATVTDLRAHIEQLLVSQSDLRCQLSDTEEELESARRLNRTLIGERNWARLSGSDERRRDALSRPPSIVPVQTRARVPARRRCEPLSGMIT